MLGDSSYAVKLRKQLLLLANTYCPYHSELQHPVLSHSAQSLWNSLSQPYICPREKFFLYLSTPVLYVRSCPFRSSSVIILRSEYITVGPEARLRLLHCCNHNSTFLCSKGDGYFFLKSSFRPPSKGTPRTDCCLNSLHRSLTSQPTITEPLFTEVPVHTACIITRSANLAIPIDVNGSNVGRCGLTFRGVGIQFSRF